MDQIKECKDGEEKQSSIFKRASQYIIERFERASRNVRKAVEYFNEASQCLNLANRGIKQRCDRARKSAKSNDLLCEEISSIIEQTDRVNDLITELTLQEQILETKSVIESDEFKL